MELELPKKVKITPEISSCEICPKLFKNDRSLKHHIAELHSRKEREIVKCRAGCDKTFSSQSCMITHLNSIHLNIRQQCNMCSSNYKSRRSLFIHKLRVHENQDPYFCEQCKKGYNSAAALKCHLKGHLSRTYRELFKCEHCVKTYSSKGGLTYHMKQKHLNKQHPKIHKCPNCPVMFRDISLRNRHVRYKHTDNFPFPCCLCDSKFKTKWAMNSHITRVHTGERLFKCVADNCSKSFVTNAELKIHSRRIHTESKDWLICPVPNCGTRIKDKLDMIGHNKYKHVKRTFAVCGICNKSFSEERSLKSHIKIVHEKQKDFHCYFCDGAFSYKNCLNTHLKRFHLKEREPPFA